MKYFLIASSLTLLPALAHAQTDDIQVRIGECHGEEFVWVDNTMTPMEIGIAFDHLQEMPDNKFLMRFEPDEIGGNTYYHWGDLSDDYTVANYCSDARYRQNKPLPGTWLFEPVSVDLSGCPAGTSPAEAMSRTMELTWEYGFDPEEILVDFHLPFAYETITLSHRTALVDAIPGLPGEVLISYDFYLASKTQIDIKAQLDMTIPTPGSAAATRCFGTFEMIATHQG